MSLRNRLVLPVILSALAVLAGCGNSTNNPVAPPTGGFTNLNFNGTYAFSVLGSDGVTYGAAGLFTACGCVGGTISGGTIDLVDAANGAPLLATGSSITSSSTYAITKDGRGLAKLQITNAALSLSTQIELAFVLTSSSHGLIIQFDGNATGSGTIDLQATAVTQSSIANAPFAFSVSGTDDSSNLSPLAVVGAFTLDANGNIVTGTGVADDNYNFNPGVNQSLTGVIGVGSGTTPGTATLTPSALGTVGFDVFPVSSTHLKFIETDGQAVTVGDAFSQTNPAIPSGNLVFSVAGFDISGGAPFVGGGIMTSDGTSTIGNGSQDVNEAGVVDGGSNPAVPLSFSGSFTATGGGRSQITFSGFGGGTLFAAYPSSGGIFLLEIDASDSLTPGITAGVVLPQSATTLAAQGYGLNLTGQDLNNTVEIDQSGEFVTTSTSMTGLVDINDGGSTSTKNIAGSYTVASNGTGAANFTSGGMAGMFFYIADSSNVVYISTDPNQVALGVFQAQSTPTSVSNAAQQHLAMLRSMHAPRSAAKQRKQLRFGLAK
jgi:hypothetical protein